MSPFPPHRLLPLRRGFSLIELLVVITIIGMMVSMTMMGVKGLRSANSLTEAINAVRGAMEQARSYAMANNTYVYVGIAETDVVEDAAKKPQTAGIGRIAVASVASTDGTPRYDPLSGAASWSNYSSGDGLIPLSKLRRVDNVHFQISGTLPMGGNMTRPTAATLLNGSTPSATPFSWPLGSAQNTGLVQFNTVIQFAPDGSANFIAQGSPASSTLPTEIEIGLQPSRGNVAPPSPSSASGEKNCAALQIDGVTGSIRVYQP